MALYSFRDPKSTRPVWPGREAISERCGYHPNVISRTTTSLEAKGWIRKTRRGKKRSNVYEIVGFDNLTESETSQESDLTELVRYDLTESVRSIRTDQITDQCNYTRNIKDGNLNKSAAGRARLAEERIANKGNR